MKTLAGRVAVVTGGASGIGFAIARALGAERMKVVLADVEAGALETAARDLAGRGIDVRAVPTDVTRPADVEALAAETLRAFGAVHVVCNNAGVFAGGPSWEAPLEDYAWVLGVNMWGVIHGVRTFVPILLRQDDEGHVVNTASMAAVTSLPYAGSYHMSKHAVLALSEVLHHELRARGAKIGVSALCPEAVATRIGEGDRNRPAHLRLDPAARPASPEHELVWTALRASVARGTSPDVIAGRVVGAIREDRFYIFSDDVWRRSCESRLEDIRLGRNPTLFPPV
jgi:NAD(P)-dependent dehydrogenase (short-subunit alcohol dehydrogenase family)